MRANKTEQFKSISVGKPKAEPIASLPQDANQLQRYFQELLSVAEQRACELATD